MLPPYSNTALERAELDATTGMLVVEFGRNDCGVCAATLPAITEAMASMPMKHLRIEDGKGRRLGRSFGIKLWPTLILLRDGKEVARVVRPQSSAEILQKLNC